MTLNSYFSTPNHVTSRISQGHSLYLVWTLWAIRFWVMLHIQLYTAGCGIIKQPPKKTEISRKRPGVFCCIFHQLMARYIYICKILKFYYDIPFTNKTMAVRSEKCHFVSEQQLISSITRNRYCFNYCKETWHGAFAERQYCCINLGLETSQLRSLAQRS